MTAEKILVLGAGGIGGYFGGRLVQAGADVTFLVRPQRQQVLQRDGLKIASPFGDAQLAVRALQAEQLSGHYDLVLLTCKAYDLDPAITSIAPALGPHSTLLPLLNGVAHLQALNARFGAARVLGGSAKIQASLDADGTVRQFNDWRYLTLGEQNGEMSTRLERIRALFASAQGVEVQAVGDIRQRLWEKLVHLCTAASMTCLMRANVGEIIRTPTGAAQFQQLLGDVAQIAASAGFAMNPAFLHSYRAVFSDAASAYSTSMLRDIERGKPTEVEHIIGFMLAQAEAVGFDCTLLQLAYTHIKAYEQRRLAGRLP